MTFQEDIAIQAQDFLKKIFHNLHGLQIDIAKWRVDHMCYRTSSNDNYIAMKNKFQNIGTLLIESEINGRDIATYKLNKAIVFEDREIDVIEVPAPKNGVVTTEGLEHIEVVIDISFEELMERYPNITFHTKAISKAINPDIEIEFADCAIKFHHQTLEKVIELEKTLQT